jgi:integrase/recombinase XerD
MEAAVGSQAPVEYAVAVEEYLSQAALGAASRRVYRISLTGWAWPLVGRPVPAGAERRGAVPPVVPLALLDDPATGGRLGAAVAERAGLTDARTVNREVSALRSAAGWWLDEGWITADPTTGLRHRAADELAAPLDAAQVDALLELPAGLREHAFWRLLLDSGAGAARVLALNADQLDLLRHRTRGHRLAGDDQPGPALAAGRADRGAGVRDRTAGAGGGRRPLARDRAGPDVLPARGGALHRADQAARPGGARLDAAPAECGTGSDQVSNRLGCVLC